jgi:hypothetical protein
MCIALGLAAGSYEAARLARVAPDGLIAVLPGSYPCIIQGRSRRREVAPHIMLLRITFEQWKEMKLDFK